MAKHKKPKPFRFSKDQVVDIRRAQRKLTDILETVDKIENCGGDCVQLREDISSLQDLFSNVDKEFIGS